MATVIVAIALCDVMFALDSIPAIFGLTQEPYLVFTANAFALMGLRQLYFLLDRLVYFSHGLALILAFIGVKLIAQAAHDSFPQIPVWLFLTVILIVPATTTIARLIASRRTRTRDGIRRHSAARAARAAGKKDTPPSPPLDAVVRPALIGSGDNRRRRCSFPPARPGADTGTPSRLTAAEYPPAQGRDGRANGARVCPACRNTRWRSGEGKSR
ncbi:TerC family protein [Nonomuraea fuscirosea]|uniref:TerC family protein n=1 Tax=Nonomuraea fuscirosea TaxID=1291556 RepID=UPI00341D5416